MPTPVTQEKQQSPAGNPANNTDPLGLFCVGSLCTEDIDDGLAAVGGAISDGLDAAGDAAGDAWDYGYEVVTDNLDDAWDFTYRNRGTIATIGAIGTCLIPAVGFAGCAYAAGAAFVARSSERIEDHGFRDSLGANLADGALTYLTLGLGGAFESAGQGLSPGLSYLGRLVPAGYDVTSFCMWLDELC